MYKRYFAVPFVEAKKRKKFLEDAYRTAKYFKQLVKKSQIVDSECLYYLSEMGLFSIAFMY